MRPRIAVLVSGSGTLLEAMVRDHLPIDLVIADRHCRGLDEVAVQANLNALLIERTDYTPQFDRDAFTELFLRAFHDNDIDIVVMAGFMTVFAALMFGIHGYRNRILNTHPSLLPKYKGAHAVRDAFEDGATVTGCTVHLATPELDAGRILAQREVPILPGDTVETLHERIKKEERVLYPKTIREFARTL